MLIKRREFLQLGTLATSSFLVPKFLKAFEGAGKLVAGNNVLVVLQLSGGNDGLNTVIPFRNDIYYRERPKLGIAKEKALQLTSEAGLHPELTFLKSLFDEGNLAILNSVGYPNPDRSHFRSMDIWQTASSSDEYKNTGWLGRWLDAQCAHCDKPTQALEMDDMLSLALSGDQMKGIALRDPARLFNASQDPFFEQILQSGNAHPAGDPNDYLYQVMAETLSGADYIFKQSKLRPSVAVYPETEIGKSFKTIASLICSDINTRVYYLSLGSFDTHVNQEDRQQKLFAEMNAAVKVFISDLKSNHRFNEVMLMTFSEFGRRVAQNASAGTDHGTANNMFLISGGLKKAGLLNGLPDLNNLFEGDLQYQLDFKRVYATLLSRWLEGDDRRILGGSYDHLDFV
ncbi:MAG: DUF1501 domain-containing protein [Bacteroidota bacterium]|nr:DUF1501 domain-containing protein [Bacteroidota bacterium]